MREGGKEEASRWLSRTAEDLRGMHEEATVSVVRCAVVLFYGGCALVTPPLLTFGAINEKMNEITGISRMAHPTRGSE